ncbi:MAG: hypothetical protein GY757_42900 [bacterium]|nr:hypothetical protein [bacterium]
MKSKGMFIIFIMFCSIMINAGNINTDSAGSNDTTNSTDTTGATGSTEQPWLKLLNLDFEETIPDGWTVRGEGYKVGPDKAEAASGKQSLCFTHVKKTESEYPAFASLRLPLKYFQGKRIRFSGKIKVPGRTNFYLWIRTDAGEDPNAFKRLQGLDPKSVGKWKEYSIEMDIPAGTSHLFVGASLRGKGRAWLDNLSIKSLPAENPKPIAISGKVVDHNEKPVPGAIITARTFFQDTALVSTTSDNNGKFLFHQPPGLVLYLTASASCTNTPYLTGGILQELSYNKDVNDLVFKLKPGKGFTIKGKVNTPGGKIPTDLYVFASRIELFGDAPFYVKPEADGRFRIRVPAGAPYRVCLDTPGLHAVPVIVKPDFKGNCTLDAFETKPAPTEVVAWIKQNAVPLPDPDTGKLKSTDHPELGPAFKKLIGNARVVAFGESSHGQREIFQMKHRFLEFLVEEMGFTVFSFEDSWPISFAVNEYVLEGKGSAEKVLSHFHMIWNTEEVLAILKWMRAYNADPSHKKKVKFFANDIYNNVFAAEFVARFLEKLDPVMLKKSGKLIDVLKNPAFFRILYDYKPEQCDSLKKDIQELLHHFDKEKENYSAKKSPRDWSVARHHVRYLQQVAHYAMENSDYDSIDIRDRAMAENTLWFLENEPPGTRIMHWAHNYHICTASYPGFTSSPMGKYLRDKLGSDYLAVGFEFNRGSFQSRDCTPSRTPFMLRSFSIAPKPGSYATAMSRADFPYFLLDLRDIPGKGAVFDWFAGPRVFKSIDSAFSTEKDVLHLFKLPEYFDAIIFIEETTRARPVASRRFPGR